MSEQIVAALIRKGKITGLAKATLGGMSLLPEHAYPGVVSVALERASPK